MLEKIEALDVINIDMDLFKQISLSDEQYVLLYNLLQTISVVFAYFIISESWQLELLIAKDIELYKIHAYKKDSKGRNVAHYAAISGNSGAMEWINKWDANYLKKGIPEGKTPEKGGLASCAVVSRNLTMLDIL